MILWLSGEPINNFHWHSSAEQAHPHLTAFWAARGYSAAGPVDFDAPPRGDNVLTPPASGAINVSAFPLGPVSSADESRYYGTRVTVVTHSETVQTLVIKAYNGGSLLEVHNPLCPGDLFASFRVSGEQVTQIDELVDRKVTSDAPLPKAEGAPPLVAQLREVIQPWGGDVDATQLF